MAFSLDGYWFAAAGRGGVGALWNTQTVAKVPRADSFVYYFWCDLWHRYGKTIRMRIFKCIYKDDLFDLVLLYVFASSHLMCYVSGAHLRVCCQDS